MTDSPSRGGPSDEKTPGPLEHRLKLVLGSIGFLFLLGLFGYQALVTQYVITDRTLYLLTGLVLLLLGFDDAIRYFLRR